MKRLLKRTLTGAAITVAVYLVVAFSHIPLVIRCATAVLCAFSVYEIANAAKCQDNHALLLGLVAAAIAAAALPIPGYRWLLQLVFPAAAVVFGYMMAKLDSCRLDAPVKVAGVALLAVFLFRAIPELRAMENGLQYLAISITLCFVTDVAAYLVGSRFGRHKLIPKVSPNKTVEGSLAGIAATLVLLLLYGWWLEATGRYQVDFFLLGTYGVLASIVSQFGDLAMSAVKRICGVKDFGRLFPGHGGMLDRFDSHLFCVPFTLLFCVLSGGFLM